jgi:PAS domain S-box-containing protein
VHVNLVRLLAARALGAALPQSIRGLLVLLLVTMTVALLAVQAVLFKRRFDQRYAEEERANVEVARAVAAGFQELVRNVLAAEAAVGAALTEPQPHPEVEVQHLLEVLAAQYPTMRHVSWISPAGRIAVSTERAAVGLDVTGRAYFQALVRGQDWAVSDLFRARVGAEAIFVIARAIRDPHGALEGVVAAAVDPTRLGKQALDIGRSGEASVLLFDASGLLIYRDPEVPLRFPRRRVARVEPFLERARAGHEVTGTYDSPIDGGRRVGAFVEVRDLGWVVGANRPTAEITAPLLGALARDQAGSLAITLAALLLAIMLARAITTPLGALEAHAVAVARGERGPPPVSPRPLELARLARAFGAMIDGIRSRESDLQRRTEEAQRAAELLHTVIETMPVGIIVIDADGVVTTANVVVERLLGLPVAGRDLHQPIASVLTTADGTPLPPAELPIMRALERGESTRDFEAAIRRPDGEEVVVLGAATPVTAEGRVIGAVAAVQDVTERRQHERERLWLLESAAREAAKLQGVFAATAEALIMYGPTGEVLDHNPAAAALLGYSPTERRPLAARLREQRPERPDGTPLPVDEVPVIRALRGEIVRGDIFVLPRGDERVWVTCSAAPLRGPDGTLLGAVATITDITRMHELQEQHEDVLRAVSHDLRTPLSVIRLQAERLRRALRAEAQAGERRAAESIATSAARIDGMLSELVESARLDAGHLNLQPRAVDVEAAIRDLLARSAGTLEDRVDVEVPALPPVWVDAGAFDRIVTNLVTNALKYSAPDTRVRVHAALGEGEVIVSVSDRGPGISAADQAQLFRRFWRSRGARRTEGLGLGLYITSRLVDAQGGRLWCESELGQGSTFSFSSPLAR